MWLTLRPWLPPIKRISHNPFYCTTIRSNRLGIQKNTLMMPRKVCVCTWSLFDPGGTDKSFRHQFSPRVVKQGRDLRAGRRQEEARLILLYELLYRRLLWAPYGSAWLGVGVCVV